MVPTLLCKIVLPYIIFPVRRKEHFRSDRGDFKGGFVYFYYVCKSKLGCENMTKGEFE